MNREQILQEVSKTLADKFDVPSDDIVMDARLVEDLGLDSIDAIDLAVYMQDMTGHRVSEEALRKIRTMSDVVDLAEELLRRA